METPPLNDAGVLSRNARDDVILARRMFFGGCALLPWLWIVNILYFLPGIRAGKVNAEVKAWVNRSMAGSAIVVSVLVAWIVIFQLNWIRWGWTDMMVVLPEDSVTQW
mmetsp:Transcript_425/g.562  ORF Transcript_425/g.562 Transcript_425/m.562 type:complete len:108 (+) Transcript_425:80-403(+)